MTTTIAESETPVTPFATLTAPSVAIVGFAEGHNNETPFGQPGWEYWGINRLHKDMGDKPWTRWFNIHDLEKFHGQDKEHLAWLRDFAGPVYLRPQDIGKFDIPNAEPFPWEQLVRMFPPYFNNTISWLMAFAIASEAKRLGIYGVDMAQDALLNAEYANQRPSCEMFIGIAVGAGIPVDLPKSTDLLKTTHLYGFEDQGPIVEKWLGRLGELGQRKEKVKAELAQMELQFNTQRTAMLAAINQLDGAQQDVQWNLRNMRPQDLGEVVSMNGKAPHGT